MILKQGSQLLVHGLHWDALSQLGDATAQARRLAQKERASKYCVVHSRDGMVEPVVGLLVRSGKTKKGELLEAAAAAFAIAVEERAALYIGATEDPEQFVLLGLLQGLPSPSFDVIGTAEEIRAKADEFQEHLTEGAPLFVHSVVHANAVLQSTLAAFFRRNGAVLQQVEQMPSASALGNVRGGELIGVGSSKPLVLGGVALVAFALIAACVWLYLDWDSKNNQTAKAKLAQEAAYQTFKTSQDTALNSVSTGVATAAAQTVWNFAKEAVLKRAGWSLSSLVCAAGSCEATYSRPISSTFDGLKKSVVAPEAERLALTLLETATVVTPIRNWEAVPLLDLQLVAVGAADLVVPLGTQAQLMQVAGLSVSITEPGNLGDFAQAVASRRSPRRYRVGTWSVSGPADTFEAAIRRLPKSSTLTSVKFTPTPDGVSYAADGRFFVLDGPK
jgi:hypothetical protein